MFFHINIAINSPVLHIYATNKLHFCRQTERDKPPHTQLWLQSWNKPSKVWHSWSLFSTNRDTLAMACNTWVVQARDRCHNIFQLTKVSELHCNNRRQNNTMFLSHRFISSHISLVKIWLNCSCRSELYAQTEPPFLIWRSLKAIDDEKFSQVWSLLNWCCGSGASLETHCSTRYMYVNIMIPYIQYIYCIYCKMGPVSEETRYTCPIIFRDFTLNLLISYKRL